MTNIVSLTEARIKKITMVELKEIFSSIDKKSAEIMISAIRKGDYNKVGMVLEFATYRKMQQITQKELK